MFTTGFRRRLLRKPGPFEIVVGLGAFVTLMYAVPEILGF